MHQSAVNMNVALCPVETVADMASSCSLDRSTAPDVPLTKVIEPPLSIVTELSWNPPALSITVMDDVEDEGVVVISVVVVVGAVVVIGFGVPVTIISPLSRGALSSQ